MKKFLSLSLVFLLLFALILPVFATETGKTYVINESDLTEDQKAKLANAATANSVSTVKQASEWVGLGKEIGSAVDGSLGALTNRAEEFANTKVGIMTMYLVAYKVLGNDAIGILNHFIRILVGVPVLIVGIILWIWSYKRNFHAYKILKSKTKEGKTYEIIEPENFSKYELGAGMRKFIYAFVLGIFLICMLAVII
jgi:hypothetical protein